MRTIYLSQSINIYDELPPAVRNLIQEIAPSKSDAEYIIGLTLKEMDRHNLYKQGKVPDLPNLFRVAISTCCRYLGKNPPPSLKSYPAWPLLLEAMIERSCSGSHEKYGLSSTELAGLLRAEFDHNRTTVSA